MRARLTAAAWARSTPRLLDGDAILRIANSANLDIAAPEAVETACFMVLETLAEQAAHRAFAGPQLSKRHDLDPLVLAWRRHKANPTQQTREKVMAAIDNAAGKGRLGPIPSPFDIRDNFDGAAAFERWLADALACHATGGRPRHKERERMVWTAQLLAVFNLLFWVKPTDSAASKRRREDKDGKERTDSAVRFVCAFESEVAAAIAGRNLRDPRGVQPRPLWFKVQTPHAVSQRILEVLSDGQWERWTLAQNADGSPAPLLIRDAG